MIVVRLKKKGLKSLREVIRNIKMNNNDILTLIFSDNND